jgi:aspartyl-tRNA(Asn)/glutamyl-tRNA(Gln) amidotransferase subunit C
MNLSEADVRRVAELANLELTPEEVRQMAEDLGEVLTHMEKLNELDTAGVAPMAQVLFEADPEATLRADRDRPGLGSEKALANAPLAGAGFFKVPQVIER